VAVAVAEGVTVGAVVGEGGLVGVADPAGEDASAVVGTGLTLGVRGVGEAPPVGEAIASAPVD
jgi:hypothetical protein